MAQQEGGPAAELPRKAAMDAMKGRGWAGARVPVELDLGQRALRLIFRGFEEYERRERLALQSVLEPADLGALRADREVTLEVAFDDIVFPRIPGQRSVMIIHVPGRRPAAVSFITMGRIDPDARGRVSWSELVRMIRNVPGARRARDAWKAAIEARKRTS